MSIPPLPYVFDKQLVFKRSHMHGFTHKCFGYSIALPYHATDHPSYERVLDLYYQVIPRAFTLELVNDIGYGWHLANYVFWVHPGFPYSSTEGVAEKSRWEK